jgi:putative transcription antitermination factor YqgF
MTSNNTIISIDLGESKAGLAIYYGQGPVLTLGNLKFKTTYQIVEKVAEEINRHSPKLVVFGLPTNKEGDITKQAQWVKEKANQIEEKIDCQIAFFDEYLTSWQADQNLEIDKSRSDEQIDEQAALIILEDYLQENG